ncbi:MAG TPA: STAS domain-containing protein [Mycobacteriales bacterium]|nr:STAS domain-containing protein [Mycobacteriales bacterium]
MTDSTAPSTVLTHRRRDGEIEVLLVGRLDLSCVGRLRDAVLLASHETTNYVAVEASRVTAVDGVGLRTLIACRRLATALGVQMVIVRPSAPLFTRLASTGLLRTFRVSGRHSTPDRGVPLSSRRAAAGR